MDINLCIYVHFTHKLVNMYVLLSQVVSEHVDEILRNETFERTIGNFDSNFSRLLLELLEKIMEFSTSNVEVKLLNILHR